MEGKNGPTGRVRRSSSTATGSELLVSGIRLFETATLARRGRSSRHSGYRSVTTHLKIVWTAARPGSSDLRTMVSNWNQRSSSALSRNSRTAPATKSATVIEAAAERCSIRRATSEGNVVMIPSATSGRSSSAINSPSMALPPLLNERDLRSVEVGALNVGLAGQNADILPERFLFDRGAQAFGDFLPRQVERQPLSRNALIDGDDMEAVTGLDQFPHEAGRAEAKDRLLELRRRVAPADLPQIAALLARGAVRHLGRHGREALRGTQQRVQGLLRASPDLGDGRRRRYLEQDVTGVHQIAAVEFPRMGIVIAPAFLIRRNRRQDLAGEQFLDCLFDASFVGRGRIKKADGDGALPQQLARGGQFVGRLGPRCDLDAIHRNAHDRIGSFARVWGVRTI